MGETYQVVTQSYLNLTVSSNNISFSTDRRFQKDVSIAELKGKLELLTGANAANMQIQAFSNDDRLVATLDNDEALLGSYPIDDRMRLHVIDNFKPKGEFEDLSQIEKFELSPEEYSKRTDSVKAFLEKNKLGKYDKEKMNVKSEEKKKVDAERVAKARSMKVGSRCEVTVQGHPTRRGTVMFVGEVHFQPGWWVGIKYDEPLGKNNGSIEGKKYFECPPKYGSFISPMNVTVGDFPEESYGLSDEDEM